MDSVEMEVVAIYSILGLVILVPVVGVTLRLALRPIVDAIIRLRESSVQTDAAVQIQKLQGEVLSLRDQMEGLEDLVNFHARLAEGGQFQERTILASGKERRS